MTYNEFLDFIGNGIQLFLDTLYLVADNLISNYFFITILGIVIFSLLFDSFVKHIVLSPVNKVCDNVDDFIDSKRKYNLYHEVRYNFMQTNAKDVFLSRSLNLQINREVLDNYLTNNKDTEFSLKLKNSEINNDVYRVMKSKESNDDKIFKRWNSVLESKEHHATEQERKELQDLIDNF